MKPSSAAPLPVAIPVLSEDLDDWSHRSRTRELVYVPRRDKPAQTPQPSEDEPEE